MVKLVQTPDQRCAAATALRLKLLPNPALSRLRSRQRIQALARALERELDIRQGGERMLKVTREFVVG
ncbi:hypothetical protein [Methylobacterium nigriterrae]|uniref:hypothetical protein n=1 Tax=Methylobacterium nigriterrae TaxID=3127512 RepID=UPI00301339F5